MNADWTPPPSDFPDTAQRIAFEATATEDCARDDDGELHPFPLRCLPGIAGEMAHEIARVTTSGNEALAGASVVALVSAAIGAGVEISTGGERRTKGNLFILAVADSGSGKGEAYRYAAEPFEDAEAEAIENFNMHKRPRLIADLKVAEARAKDLCKRASVKADPAARALATEEFRQAEEEFAKVRRLLDAAPCWKVADVTKEKLALVMSSQPGEAVSSLSSEARGILSIVRGKYTKEGGDEDFYCSAYSGDSIAVDRVSRERVTLRRPCLSILWMIQPDVARKAFGDETLMESGLLPRFLSFDAQAEPQEREKAPQPIPDSIKEGWRVLVRKLVETYRSSERCSTVSVSPSAAAHLDAFERENIRRRKRKGDLHDLASFVARWAENAWRLALVLHCAKHAGLAHSSQLSESTAQNAVELMRWFIDRQVEMLASGRREKQRSRLSALSAILAEHGGEIPIRTLRRSHGFKEEEVRRLQVAFPGRIRVETRQPAVGRPSQIVTDRPAVS